MHVLALHSLPSAVAGTVMFLVFVAHKMRQRVRLGCCGIGEGAAADRAAVLALAGQLYRAAAANPAAKSRYLAAPACLRPVQQPAYLPPTLTAEDMTVLRSPRSPAAAPAHLEAAAASSPWSHASELSYTSLQRQGPEQQQQQLQLQLPQRPPRPPRPPTSLPGTLWQGSAPAGSSAGSSSPAASKGPGAAPLQRWPTVHELVRAWSRSRSATREGEVGAAGVASADLLVSGAAAGGAAQHGHASTDLEAQRGEAPFQLPEARAFTWSQLGISQGPTPAISRRASETTGQPPSLPPQAALALLSDHLPQGELHAVSKPVFAPYGWSHHGAPAAGGPSTNAHSLSQQLWLQPSRLSHAASYAGPAPDGPDADVAAALAAAGAARTWGGASEAASREGSSHHGRRSSLHPAGSGAGWAAEPQGAGMGSRASQQSLRLRSEIDGLGCINE